MNTITIDDKKYEIPPQVSDLIIMISKERDELRERVSRIMAKSIGWTHADNCVDLDSGKDPRLKNVPEMLDRALADFER